MKLSDGMPRFVHYGFFLDLIDVNGLPMDVRMEHVTTEQFSITYCSPFGKNFLRFL